MIIAMQRLDKQPAIRNNWTNVFSSLLGNGHVNISPQHIIALNNMTSIARQPSGKQASSTIKAVFSVGSVRSLYNDSLWLVFDPGSVKRMGIQRYTAVRLQLKGELELVQCSSEQLVNSED
jgi:subtilase family serine protease